MDKIPHYLDNFFEGKNFILIYPTQSIAGADFQESASSSLFDTAPVDYQTISTLVKTIGKLITRR